MEIMLTLSVLNFSQVYAVSVAVIDNVKNSEIVFVKYVKQCLNRSRGYEYSIARDVKSFKSEYIITIFMLSLLHTVKYNYFVEFLKLSNKLEIKI